MTGTVLESDRSLNSTSIMKPSIHLALLALITTSVLASTSTKMQPSGVRGPVADNLREKTFPLKPAEIALLFATRLFGAVAFLRPDGETLTNTLCPLSQCDVILLARAAHFAARNRAQRHPLLLEQEAT